MKKRITALLMALALSLTLLPTAALAEEPVDAPQTETEIPAPSGGGAENSPADADGTNAEDADGAVDTDSTDNADSTVTALQALIDALPDAENVAEDGADEIVDALDAVDAAKAALTDEQRAQVDFARYDALCAALAALAGETGAAVPMAADTRNTYDGQLSLVSLGTKSGDGWSWDCENLTLTLTNVDITCALKSGSAVNLPSGNVTIVLVGENTISNTAASGQGLAYGGSSAPSVTFQGSGSLTVTAAKGTGIQVKDITVTDNSTVNVTAGKAIVPIDSDSSTVVSGSGSLSVVSTNDYSFTNSTSVTVSGSGTFFAASSTNSVLFPYKSTLTCEGSGMAAYGSSTYYATKEAADSHLTEISIDRAEGSTTGTVSTTGRKTLLVYNNSQTFSFTPAAVTMRAGASTPTIVDVSASQQLLKTAKIQWESGEDWVETAPGGLSAVLSSGQIRISSTTAAKAGDYSLRLVSDEVKSAAVTVTVQGAPLTITRQPANVDWNTDRDKTAPSLTVAAEPAEGQSGEISYAWFKEGGSAAVGTSSTLSLDDLADGSYVYYCRLTLGDYSTETDHVTVSRHSCAHNWSEAGKCSTCGTQAAAVSGDRTYYESAADLSTALSTLDNYSNPQSLSVKLLSNAEVGSFTIGYQSSLTLDLNGKTLTGKIQVSKGGSTALATLTVKDSGKTGTLNGSIAVFQNGELNIEGGTFTYSGSYNFYYSPMTENNQLDGHAAVVIWDAKSPVRGTISGGTFSASGDNAYGIYFHKDSLLQFTGGTFTNLRSNIGSLAAQLADGYCYVTADGQQVERSALTDKDLTGTVTVKPCTDHDYGTAKNCIYCNTLNPDSMEAAIGETRYGTLEEALKALKDGDTLTLLSDHTLTDALTLDKTVTLDFNGRTLSRNAAPVLDITAAGVTVKNSSAAETGGAAYTSADTKDSCAAQVASGASLTVTGGTFTGGLTVAEGGAAALSGGAYYKTHWPAVINGNAGGAVNALLKGGNYAFQDDNGRILDGSGAFSYTRVMVVSHACTYGVRDNVGELTGKCACGRVCPHANVDPSTGVCKTCGMEKAAKLGNTFYDTLSEALYAASSRQSGTVTLLKSVVYPAGKAPNAVGGTFTLDLNGKTLSAHIGDLGVLNVKGANITVVNGTLENTQDTGGSVAAKVESGSLTIGSSMTLTSKANQVSSSNNLKLPAVAVTGGSLTVLPGAVLNGGIQVSGGSVKLSGGTIRSGRDALVDPRPIIDGAAPNSVLADGYAFADESGALLDGSVPLTADVVKIVPHQHSFGESTGKCACGLQMAASIMKNGSTAYYDAADAAFAAAQPGDTVRLLTNAVSPGAFSIGKAFTLDLNGHNVNAVTVSAAVKIRDSSAVPGTVGMLTLTGSGLTLGDLLEPGFGFKSGGSWLTAGQLAGKSASSVTVVKAPIQSVTLPESQTITYGDPLRLLAAVNGTGTIRFTWYLDSDTVGADTGTKNTYDIPASLNAGTHTVRCAASCDGYTVLSNETTVTVKKADIRAASITVPTALTSLTYTGMAQALTAPGSVAAGGTMQYSLTQGGAYAARIPTAVSAGTYTVWYKAVGDENHNDSAPASVEAAISPAPLTFTVSVGSKRFNGEADAVVDVKFNGLVNNERLTSGMDYTVEASYDNAKVGDGKPVTGTVTLESSDKARNYVLADGAFSTTGSILKGFAPQLAPISVMAKAGTSGTVSLTGSTGMPGNAGKLTYRVTAGEGFSVDENGTVSYTVSGSAGETRTAAVTVSSENYEDAECRITVTLTDKNIPTVTASDITATYTGKPLNASAAKGTAVFGGKPVSGVWSWKDAAPVGTGDSGMKTLVFTPSDDAFAAVEVNVYVLIGQAKPTGTPVFSSVTSGGQTLGSVTVDTGKLTPNYGSFSWDDPADTVIVQGQSYGWSFTPDDENYGRLTGSAVLWAKTSGGSTGGGGGGGGGAAAAPSVTVPVSSAKNTVTVDASVSGSTASISISDQQIESVASGGGSVTVDVSGLKNVDSAKLPSSVIGKTEQAGAGLTVALPTGSVALDAKALESIGTGKDVTVSVQQTTLTDAQRSAVSALAQVAVVVDVNVVVGTSKQSGFGGGRLTVSIPYALKSGEDPAKLAVWFIRDDGTIENKGGSYDAKAGAFVFTTEHLSQYLLVNTDNVLTFTDVPATAYYAGAVAWAAEKGITSGTKDGRFDPNGSCTRAQIVTFLWRAAGSPEPKSAAGFADVSDSAYYAKAVAWAVENGITAGTKDGRFDPDAPCTRAQSVTFLYRAAGSPTATGGAGFSDVAANAYYAAAVAWAVENGVTTGTKDGGFSPNTACTRAQIVTFLYRSVK
ncbi:S-layer homology domain-containing protein [uncultured Oscillibacter sp.]|uniref:S-layer homology domain-containing protein n=1 Tax=uncultured Oscillibacter sp. TaxID=876091 RepID=UPI0025DEDE35|nr:S-layer homology domain-containing protein [uncultured Oscillibacter sp.]